MTTSLYDLTVPPFIRGLTNMAAVLKKGALFAEEQGMDPAILVDARLYADMAPFSSQVQRASDAAKGCVVRLGGVDNVVFADDEASFEQLQARVARTIAFLETVPREALDGREDAAVMLEAPNRTFHFTGLDYVLTFAQPNFYFHATTAYAILRHKGVPVGKLDYLGGI